MIYLLLGLGLGGGFGLIVRGILRARHAVAFAQRRTAAVHVPLGTGAFDTYRHAVALPEPEPEPPTRTIAAVIPSARATLADILAKLPPTTRRVVEAQIRCPYCHAVAGHSSGPQRIMVGSPPYQDPGAKALRQCCLSCGSEWLVFVKGGVR